MSHFLVSGQLVDGFRKEAAQMNVYGKDMFGYVVKNSAALVIVTLMSACANEEGRIYVYRTSVGWFRLFGNDMARVNIDGNDVGGCKYRGFSMFRLPPGSHVLTVDNGGFPGKCSIDIDVEEGKDHYYVVQRRAAPMIGTMAGFLISGPILSGGFLGFIAGGNKWGQIRLFSSSQQCGKTENWDRFNLRRDKGQRFRS